MLNDSKLIEKRWDLIIVGGGNAALCAAIEAGEKGLKVLILESAPKHYRGGNSRHTRNFRCMHKAPLGELTDSYLEDEYMQDLLAVTKGNTDPELASLAIEASEECFTWMQDHGVRFQPSLTGTLSLSRTNAFFLGGGKALVNAYYQEVSKHNIHVAYNATVNDLISTEAQMLDAVAVDIAGKQFVIHARSFVLASGGFQANIEWLTEAWGPSAQNFLIRGTPYNKGQVLKKMLETGADSVGDPTQCHAVAIDGRAPKFDGGIATRLDCVPFSIVVNKHGERFYDEGEDVWPKRYAIWGRLVAAQPDQVGYAIIDSQSIDLFMPSVFPPVKANTLEELINSLGLPLESTLRTIDGFNKACREGDFHPNQLDSLATDGLTPPKSNWARALTKPPYYGYLLKPGVTFTYLGLKVDKNAKVQSAKGEFKNVWAAGEIMAGSILGQGYLAGFGMTIGTVFGRIAGQQAAHYLEGQKS